MENSRGKTVGKCTQALKKFYEDDTYNYYFPNGCYRAYVVYSNGEKYSIVDAITKKKISVKELINKGAMIELEKKKSAK